MKQLRHLIADPEERQSIGTRRKIAGNAELEAVFAWPLSRADQIRSQQQRQRGWKLYSFHAPEVECIGRGKMSRMSLPRRVRKMRSCRRWRLNCLAWA
jgi:hypothetical protein